MPPLTPLFTRAPVRTCILPGDFACFTRAASRAVTRAVGA